MVTRQMCSLNRSPRIFAKVRQRPGESAVKRVGEGDKKSWFCSEFVTDAFPKPGIHLHWRNRAGLALPICAYAYW